MTAGGTFREQRLNQFQDDICWALARLLADSGDTQRFECHDSPHCEAVMDMMKSAFRWADALPVEVVRGRAEAVRQLQEARQDVLFMQQLGRLTQPKRRKGAAR